ncbi:MAG TPA: DUF732 domain-containing protein [Mycobacterium sp.]|uniref:DUF732 domain-containing protein n=1 Tax=Mycobacterium sp. TaxID=1785 RepID=UPI002D2DCF31|nr:DUF732 domain-containing protein [Mycobacterium sp.]HXY64717.1 DUF732 domain-containing protein [Mycobacterium sp.]
MTRTNVGPEKSSTVCALLLSAAALLSAAPASADPTDVAFVAALAKEGIVVTDHNTAIAIAHTVCAGFDKSNKTAVPAMKLMKDNDLSLKQSSYFIGASIAAYCPQYIGRTDNSANWLYPRAPLK